MGRLSLRKRYDRTLDCELYEIKLGNEYLMSSFFTESEKALASLGIEACQAEHPDIVVGGLGLGYTARAVLDNSRVASLVVVEALRPVIDWHLKGLLPLGPELAGDFRCRLVHGDFFAMSASPAGFDPDEPHRRFDAILVDIDHSPYMWLDPGNENFYQPEGLGQLVRHLKPGGVFGLWSNDPPDSSFIDRLKKVFGSARGVPVVFMNPLQNKEFTQTVYLSELS